MTTPAQPKTPPKKREIPATEKECPYRAKLVEEIKKRLERRDESKGKKE